MHSFSTSIKSLTFLVICDLSWWSRKWEYFNRFEILSSWIIFIWVHVIQHYIDTLCSHGLPHLKKHSYQTLSQILSGFLLFFLVILPLQELHWRKSVDQQNAVAIAEPLSGSVWQYKYEQYFSESHLSLFWAISSAGYHTIPRTSWVHYYLNETENKRVYSSLWKENLLNRKQREIATNVPCICSSKQNYSLLYNMLSSPLVFFLIPPLFFLCKPS